MEITGGSCRLGLWYVHVWWRGEKIHRIRFARTGIPGRSRHQYNNIARVILSICQFSPQLPVKAIPYLPVFIRQSVMCHMVQP